MKIFFILILICILNFNTSALAVDTSSSIIKKQVELNPENLKLRLSLAQSYFDEGKFELAAETIKERGEKLSPESLILLAKAYQKLNDPNNEGKFLEQLTTNFPRFALGFVAFGDYLYRKSLLKNDPKISMNCLAAYKTAIEINPNLRVAFNGLLKAYEQYKNFYEERVLLEDMLKQFGRAADILTHLCRRNTVDGYFVNARKYCTEAINADDKKTENYIYLALVENNTGEIKKAEIILKKATEKFSNSEFTLSNYADFLIQQKNLPGGETYFGLASKADPKSFRAQFGLAQTSFELKHYDSAITAYKKSCIIDPYQTYRSLKRSTDLLRHRNEQKFENQFLAALEKCQNGGNSENEARSPAMSIEEARTPFSVYSKNKIVGPIGF